jgi:RHS repeat-associated protein
LFYDGLNRCIARQINGVVTLLYYNGWHITEEFDGSGSQQARNYYGTAPDEILGMLRGGITYMFQRDVVGTIVRLTNPAGQEVESYTYGPFGIPLQTSGVGNRFMFTGREWLSQVALYDYRNRMYSPMIGRFIQTDATRFRAGDINLNRYCGNGYTYAIDPNGLWQFTLSGGYFGGATVTFGRNGGQWNVSGQIGLAIGASVSYTNKDTGAKPVGALSGFWGNAEVGSGTGLDFATSIVSPTDGMGPDVSTTTLTSTNPLGNSFSLSIDDGLKLDTDTSFSFGASGQLMWGIQRFYGVDSSSTTTSNQVTSSSSSTSSLSSTSDEDSSSSDSGPVDICVADPWRDPVAGGDFESGHYSGSGGQLQNPFSY